MTARIRRPSYGTAGAAARGSRPEGGALKDRYVAGQLGVTELLIRLPKFVEGPRDRPGRMSETVGR